MMQTGSPKVGIVDLIQERLHISFISYVLYLRICNISSFGLMSLQVLF